MGHFYCSNISQHVVKMVYAKGKVTLDEMVASAMRRRMKIHAAEGSYDNEEMLEQGIEELMLIHVDQGTLEPILENEREREVWFGYRNDEFDWEADEYQEFRKIKVRFTRGARKRYLTREIPHISYIEH